MLAAALVYLLDGKGKHLSQDLTGQELPMLLAAPSTEPSSCLHPAVFPKCGRGTADVQAQAEGVTVPAASSAPGLTPRSPSPAPAVRGGDGTYPLRDVPTSPVQGSET